MADAAAAAAADAYSPYDYWPYTGTPYYPLLKDQKEQAKADATQ